MYIEYYASDGSLMCLGDVNELYHYNHNHDALGRFASKVGGVSSMPVSTPRQYKKKLNQLEKLSAKGRGMAMYEENRAGKQKAKNNERGAKYSRDQAKKYRKAANKADAAAKRTAAEAFTKEKYSVSEKIVTRNSQKTKDVLISAGILAVKGGIPVVVGYNVGAHIKDNKVYRGRYKGENPRKVYGKSYSVKKPKKGEKPTYTKANKSYDNYGQLDKTYTTTNKNGEVIRKKVRRK